MVNENDEILIENIDINNDTTSVTKLKKRTEGTRMTKASGPNIIDNDNRSNLIGGIFDMEENPLFIEKRMKIYDRIMLEQKEKISKINKKTIKIELKDGTKKEGISWKTTPFDIVHSISTSLIDSIVIAKVRYNNDVIDPFSVDQADIDGNELSNDVSGGCCNNIINKSELWDMKRPLIGDCKLEFLKFDDREGKMVFWHSSAHILGECLECLKGAHLTIGPPVENGFYYDSYIGTNTILETDYKTIEKKATQIIKEKQNFERIVLTKDEALELFQDNVFKFEIIKTKIPDNGKTTAYRCGTLIDLCRGPHVIHTGKIKAFLITRTSSAYWLGNTKNDSLQRIYGISFPDKQQLKEWKHFQEEAAKRDHRKLGVTNDLFFFHHLSPGSCFWLPYGTKIYENLLNYLKSEYRKRGYKEVITPNMFNIELWNISGHAKHYKENMFCFDVEKNEFALKPMNCPSHCLMFDFRQRSYRELPLRMADFGVLHRNEFSGALTGLTRVRRFQQDDAHIFCREDQIKEEVLNFLNFMKDVYETFGLKYKVELSTRPAKALGSDELWQQAEEQLGDALNCFVGKGNWRENPGDGAFYGPKIDVIVTDALERQHQCATVQLDFQLPIRFNLKYRADNNEEVFQRPVIIHRAIYGSLERFIAIITEHYAGKYPFWLSPRQALIVPVSQNFIDYGYKVKNILFENGFDIDIDDSGKTLNKKIREGQMLHYNYILVLGAKEETDQSINIRTRDNIIKGTKTIQETIEMFNELKINKVKDE